VAHFDVVAQLYTVEGTQVKPSGEPAALLKLATPETALALFTDGAGNLWAAGPGRTAATAYAVVARKPRSRSPPA
jgi:hypothetical protein